MTKFPKVTEYMDVVVHTLRPEIDIYDAVDFLLHHHVTGAPVVDHHNNLIGIVTAKDCLRLLSAGAGDEKTLPRGRVSDYMTRDVICIPPKMDIYFAAGIFLTNNFRRLPVVLNGILVGAITRFDILRVIRVNLG